MSLSSEQRQHLGEELFRALSSCQTLAPLTERFDNIDIEDAYYISQAMLKARLDHTKERIVGKKIGVTSLAVQEMLGVYQPDFGFLTSNMAVNNKADCPIEGNLIQPRAEAEIAFLLKQDLQGPGVTEQDVLNATECIMPCFEIVDSRIKDWKIKIQDTIADNASCGVFVIGDERVSPHEVDLPNLEVTVFKNGAPISNGKGSAVQGNPLTAVAWLANTLGEFGIPFKAGEVILSGSLVPLEPVVAGDEMHMELSGIGSATVRFC
ncbi:fumarylacetoacetate hydrolase family protein [Ketobacter alkanivorans]|uniref:2-oxopent-4-enoate hydratase n=1 Tax=Ketobacter alkanivorans TaxID=1917421 RepID=A0A2K9LJ96_9GAMM|nr:2-oxopent-4-enoate hydratase [Ketobacter alkanivorans]